MKHLSFSLLLAVLCMGQALPLRSGPISDLQPGLTSTNLSEVESATLTLQALVAQAGKPGADGERAALCRERAGQLTDATPVPVATLLVRQLRFIGGEESVEALAALLTHADAHLRDDARQALESNPSPRAGKVLVQALARTKEPRDLVGLLGTLGQRRDEGAAQALAPFLTAEDESVATSAIRALAHNGGREAAAALLKFRAAAPAARQGVVTLALFDAALSAQRQGDQGTAGSIYKALWKAEEPEPIRANALAGLLGTDAKGAPALLDQVMKGSSETLKSAAITALSRAGNAPLITAAAAHLSTLPEPLQIQLLTALSLAGDHSLAAPVAALLASTNEAVDRAAVKALATVGDVACVPALIAAAGQGNLKKEAASALEDLDAPGVNEKLLELLTGGSPEQRPPALDALLARQAPGLQTQLLKLARDRDEKLATTALTALKRIAGPADFEALLAVVQAAPSRAVAEVGLGVLFTITSASPAPAERIAEIGKKLEPASPDIKRALLSSLSKYGQSATPAEALAALNTIAGQLDNPALQATAAYFCVDLADRLLALDPAAMEKLLGRIATLSIPEDLRSKIKGLTGLEDGWLLKGLLSPAYESGADLFTKPFAPETANAAVAWRPLAESDRDKTNNRMLDLARTLQGDNRVAYLRFAFRQAAAGKFILELGSDDGVMVWLNGRQIHSKDVVRGCRPGDDKVEITLQEGVNSLLVKVVQRAGQWQFVGRVVPVPAP
jgi:HEAT repeat protein